jgi:hypothetical protein
VIDLPLDIEEKPDAGQLLQDVRGELVFDDVTFVYQINSEHLLRDVERHGRMDNVQAVLSDDARTSGQRRPEEKRPPAENLPAKHPEAAARPAAMDGEEDLAHLQARDVALRNISFRASPGSWWPWSGPAAPAKPP